jgi:hypothetical protein
VQARGQPEVALEKRAGFSEQIEEFFACRHGLRGASLVYNSTLNRTAPPDVYLTDKPPISC